MLYCWIGGHLVGYEARQETSNPPLKTSPNDHFRPKQSNETSLPVRTNTRLGPSVMDLGETPTLHADSSLENGTTCATATALAQVLDSQAITSTSLATFSVTSVPGSAGLAVLTPTLDGTTTVTSLPGFTLSSFDSVDVKHVSESHEMAVATVGEDGRYFSVSRSL